VVCLIGGNNQHFFKNIGGGNFGGKLWEKIRTEQGQNFLYIKSPQNKPNSLLFNTLAHSYLSTSVDNSYKTPSIHPYIHPINLPQFTTYFHPKNYQQFVGKIWVKNRA
jgi:hypothetical protein